MAGKDKVAPTRLDKVRELYGPWGDGQDQDEQDYWALFNHLADWIDKNYGHRCQESSGGCACCQAWAVYDLARAIFMDPE